MLISSINPFSNKTELRVPPVSVSRVFMSYFEYKISKALEKSILSSPDIMYS